MKNSHLPPSEKNKIDPEDIRAAYQSSVQLIVYEGGLSWHTTSVFIHFATLLIAGAVFPAFLGSVNQRLIAVVGLIFSVAGFAASIMWWSMVARNRRYYEFWFYSARELEKMMHSEIQTFQRGFEFSRGNEVSVANIIMKFKFIERIRMKSNLNLFYGLFTLIFVLLGIINVYRIIIEF
ncbi:MAG TPA: hypothetical protein VJT09_04650 [Pyrinomonadaceae bacterium]|nr:hypothetical protein [Pyrinomonadaceae bacterium]